MTNGDEHVSELVEVQQGEYRDACLPAYDGTQTVDVLITGVHAIRESDGFLRINVGPATAIIDDAATNVTVTPAKK